MRNTIRIDPLNEPIHQPGGALHQMRHQFKRESCSNSRILHVPCVAQTHTRVGVRDVATHQRFPAKIPQVGSGYASETVWFEPTSRWTTIYNVTPDRCKQCNPPLESGGLATGISDTMTFDILEGLPFRITRHRMELRVHE